MVFFDYKQPLAYNAALCGACALGITAAIQLLEYFRTALIPFAIATMVSGCLEWFVQVFEAFIIRFWAVLQCTFACSFCRSRWRHNRPVAPELQEGLVQAAGNTEPEEAECCFCAALPENIRKDIPMNVRRRWRNEYGGSSFLARMLAVVLTLLLTALVLVGLYSVLCQSLMNVEWGAYECGVLEVVNASGPLLRFLDVRMENLTASVAALESKQGWNYVEPYITAMLSQTRTWVMQLTMFLLYTLLWLLQPIPSTETVYLVVRTYFMLKTACNIVFGVLVWCLLLALEVHLAAVIALVCAILSYMPEVGAIAGMLLPLPFILLDAGKLCTPDTVEAADLGVRLWRVGKAALGLLGMKTAVSNGLEPLVMGKNKVLAGMLQIGKNTGEAAETHPVILLLIVVLMGTIWGATGMLVSVPMVSFIRLAVNVHESEGVAAARRRRGETA